MCPRWDSHDRSLTIMLILLLSKEQYYTTSAALGQIPASLMVWWYNGSSLEWRWGTVSKNGCSGVSLCQALQPHTQEVSCKKAVLCIDSIIMVALWGSGYAIESHPLAQVSGVEYIIRVQQNYVIAQENIPEVTESFKSEAGSDDRSIAFLPLLHAMVKCHGTLASRQLHQHSSRPSGPFFPRKF